MSDYRRRGFLAGAIGAAVGQLGLDLSTPAPSRRREAALESVHLRGEPVTVEEAKARDARAKAQELLVLELFRTMPDKRMTPTAVLLYFAEAEWPLTSVRRAITNLEKSGWLIRHSRDRVESPRGGKEGKWSLAPRPPATEPEKPMGAQE